MAEANLVTFDTPELSIQERLSLSVSLSLFHPLLLTLPHSKVQQTVVDMQWHKITQNAIVRYFSGKLTSVARWRRHSVQLVPQTRQVGGGRGRASLGLNWKTFHNLCKFFESLFSLPCPLPPFLAAQLLFVTCTKGFIAAQQAYKQVTHSQGKCICLPS